MSDRAEQLWRGVVTAPDADPVALEQAWRYAVRSGSTSLARIIAGRHDLTGALRSAVAATRTLEIAKAYAARGDLTAAEIAALADTERRVTILAALASSDSMRRSVPASLAASAHRDVLISLAANRRVPVAGRIAALEAITASHTRLTLSATAALDSVVRDEAKLNDWGARTGGRWLEVVTAGRMSAQACRDAAGHLLTQLEHRSAQRLLAAVLGQEKCPEDLRAEVPAAVDAAVDAAGWRSPGVAPELVRAVRRSVAGWRPSQSEQIDAGLAALAGDDDARDLLTRFGSRIAARVALAEAVSDGFLLELLDGGLVSEVTFEKALRGRCERAWPTGRVPGEAHAALLERFVKLRPGDAAIIAGMGWGWGGDNREAVEAIERWVDGHITANGRCAATLARQSLIKRDRWPASRVGELSWAAAVRHYGPAVWAVLHADLGDDDTAWAIVEQLGSDYTGTVDELAAVCRAARQ